MVAKNDITCYKVLLLCDNGSYVTPCQGTSAKLNETLKAEDKRTYLKDGCNNIDSGFIHALLIVKDATGGFNGDCKVFVSTIPAGTEFYVSDNFEEICARKIFITDKVVDKADGRESIAYIMNMLRDDYKQTIEEGKVSIGDFCVVQPDGSKKYIHRYDYTAEMNDDIIGVVGFYDENGKPVVISRESSIQRWCTLEYDKCHLINNEASSEIYGNYKKFLNGKELTENVLKSKYYKPEKYPIFKWISEYKTKGTESGDWYVGAIGELIKMYENIIQINISLFLLDGAALLDSYYWSSSEFSSNSVYYVATDDGLVGSYFKLNNFYARAFLRV
jgi:hypothetical protein